MMQFKKQAAAFFLALVLGGTPLSTFSAQAVQTGAAMGAQEAAEYLYEMGLLQGTGVLSDGSPDFNLEGTVTRGEAAAMLVRLLGEERAALSIHYCHPFQDAGWAQDYVGYAYYTGITSGTSDVTFGTLDRIDEAQFVTMVLRALGYTQADWRNPYPTADQAGLAYPGAEDFRRGDLAAVCCSALACRVNGGQETLQEQLERQGAFSPESGPVYSFTPGPVTEKIDMIRIASPAELVPQVAAAVNSRSSEVTLQIPAGQEESYQTLLLKDIEALQDIQSVNFSWYPGSGVLWASFQYNDAARAMAYLEGKSDSLSPDDMRMLNEAKHIHASIVDSSMSEYEQVKAIHDYLVNSTAYKNTGERSFSAYGALVDGYAVCDGYSEAFDLLCYLSGIDCTRVLGVGRNSFGQSEAHAWNKVKIDGSWYNVDVTWDDPISSVPILLYDYFLLSDQAFSANHIWTAYDHWPASPANYLGK